MPRAGVVVSGLIAVIGAVLGLVYGYTQLTTINLNNLINPRNFFAIIIVVVSLVVFICSLLLLIDKLALINSLIVIIWGILLLFVFGGGILSEIAAILEILGGFIGLIASIVT
jgi:hypothetical protein